MSINTAAVARPDFVREGAQKFGSQCIVAAIDAKRAGEDRWEVRSPRLQRAGAELAELGVPLSTSLAVMDTLKRNCEAIAKSYVRLFLDIDFQNIMRTMFPLCSREQLMFRSTMEEVAALTSLGLFVSMIAIWAQVIAVL